LLDENRLAIACGSPINPLPIISHISLGAKMLVKGKLPPLIPHKIPDVKKIKKIHKEVKNET